MKEQTIEGREATYLDREVISPRNEALVERQDAMHFSLWLKEGNGRFKLAMRNGEWQQRLRDTE